MSSPDARPQSSLAALTGARFFAALWVLVYHRAGAFLEGGPRLIAELRASGYAAVSFFFVLSGFVLAWRHADDLPLDRRRFRASRIARIAPLYVLAWALTTPFVFARAHHSLALTAAAGGVHLVALQSWIPGGALSWNVPAWSVSCEVFFYALFPTLLEALRRRRWSSRSLHAAIAIVLLAGVALPRLLVFAFLSRGSWSAPWMDLVLYSPLARLPEFVLGILLAERFLLEKRAASETDDGGAMTFAALALLAALFASSSDLEGAMPLLHTALAAPLFALLVLGLARGGGILGRALAQPTLVTLGAGSYALYILQQPILDALLSLRGEPLVAPPPSLALLVEYLALMIAVSLAAERFVAEPLRRSLATRLSR